jgi:Putative bacterial sensory transduction regulator
MQPIQVYYEMVEKVIKELGVDPAICRGQNLGQWNMRLGSASVWIDVFQSKDAQGNFIDGGYLQIMAPVMEVPSERQLEFFQEVLEINHQLYGVGMTKFQNSIYVKSIRELDNLEQSEVMSTFNRVGRYADQYDDSLKAKYAAAGRAPQ